jgi:hypothetical protein
VISTVTERPEFRVNPALLPAAETIDSHKRVSGILDVIHSRPPTPLNPLSRAFYLNLYSDAFPASIENMTTIEELTTHFELTVKTPHIEDKGYLSFVFPESVDPKLGALFSPDLSGQVNLHLNVEGGHRYLVDFVVSSQGMGVYRVIAESGEYSEEDTNGTYSHVLALLTAAGSGWTQVDLMQDSGTGFELHGVEVTSIDMRSVELHSIE